METVFCILAGGKSSRFKEDKRRATLNNKTLLEIIHERLRKFSGQIVLSVRKTDDMTLEGTTIVHDNLDFAGPVCGIVDVIKSVSASRYLFFAADMPFITENMVNLLLKNCDDKIALFTCRGKLFPLPICIPKNIAIKIKNHCANKRIVSLLDEFDYKTITLYSEDCHEFYNINTQDDLKEAALFFKE